MKKTNKIITFIFAFLLSISFYICLSDNTVHAATVSRTWQFYEYYNEEISESFNNVPFSSNNMNFTGFEFLIDYSIGELVLYYHNSLGEYTVYDYGWYDNNFRTVSFNTAPSGYLLTFLRRYAIEIPEQVITHTVIFDLAGGTRSGGGELRQTIVSGGSAVAPSVYKVGYNFIGWNKSLNNITSDITITAQWSVNTYEVYFNIGNYVSNYGSGQIATSLVQHGSNVTYYNVNGQIISLNNFNLRVPGKRFVGWDKSLNNIDSSMVFNAVFEDVTISFTYVNSATVNNSGGYVYTYKTDTFVLGYQPYPNFAYSLSYYTNRVNALDYPKKYFQGWSLDGQNIYTDSTFTDNGSNISFNAVYVDNSYYVTFYDTFNPLTSLPFKPGLNTIKDIPDFNLGIGKKIIGWSLELNGTVLDLSNYNLQSNIDLYAITSFNSTIENPNFDIPYNDCSTFDIPCHLGNAFIYFLNDFPIISDIVHLFLPITSIVSLVTENMLLFDTFGWIFSITIAVLFIYFVFRMFK